MATNYDKIREENIRGYGEFTHHLELLGRLYADPTHFIFELLQNAEDAGAKKVKFSLYPDRLEFLNDGRSFTEADVHGICAIGKGTKAQDLTQIGKFGIGFKSVYAHTSNPQIYSGSEQFRIEHYVRPYAEDRRSVPSPWSTLFVLPFHQASVSYAQIAAKLERLDTTPLLFLKSLREIEWSLEGGQSGLFIREAEACGTGQLTRIVAQRGKKETDEEWLLFARQLPLDAYPHDSLLPEHKKLRVEIGFLVRRSSPDSKITITRIPSSPLVVFFPTEKPTNLGFLIQGPFRTTPTRENVPPNDPWNGKLVQETAELAVDALNRLRDVGLLSVSALEALPIHAEAFPEGSMFRPIFDRVRAALKDERLLPSNDETFTPAKDAKLARGGDLRELLPDEQLQDLYGGERKWKWLSHQITKDRTPGLCQYLTEELAIEEIEPETFARKLNKPFLERQSDEWIVRFYSFLNEHKALWRSSPYGGGPLRNEAIIRLDDDSHVTPFRDGNTPKVYLPTAEGSDLPTVKGTITQNQDAVNFLQALGLREPDLVAEVIERILPKYAEGKTIPADEHARDLRRVVAALKAVTRDRAAALVEAVFEFPFLHARNAATASIAFKKLGDTEFETETTRLLFEGNPDIWFVDDDFSNDAFAHVEAWGIVSTRISPCAIGAQGDVSLQNTWGSHKRGLGGFDGRCDITGLAHALKTITTAKARCLWNEILPGHSRHIRGVVESSSRQDYRDSEKTIELLTTGRFITKSSWLPGPDGKFFQASALTLDELPEDFIRNSDLARFLGMKPTIPSNLDKESLFRAAGLMPEAARFAKENTDLIERLAKRPDLLEQIREKLEESRDNLQHEAKPLDYRAEIAETFSREARRRSRRHRWFGYNWPGTKSRTAAAETTRRDSSGERTRTEAGRTLHKGTEKSLGVEKRRSSSVSRGAIPRALSNLRFHVPRA